MTTGFIGESVHAQIPRIYWTMNELLQVERASSSLNRLNGSLVYITEVITRQIAAGADYIFFDTAVVPIATDMEATYTHKTMHGIQRIMNDSMMTGVHTAIGLSNCSHMMPNRIAINRAYLHVAMEHGLDAAVLDPTIDYGMKTPGKGISGIINELAENDGSDMMKGFEIFEQIAEYSRKYGKR